METTKGSVTAIPPISFWRNVYAPASALSPAASWACSRLVVDRLRSSRRGQHQRLPSFSARRVGLDEDCPWLDVMTIPPPLVAARPAPLCEACVAQTSRLSSHRTGDPVCDRCTVAA